MSASVIQTVSELRDVLAHHRKEGSSLGVVPTMGALHAGHQALIRRAAELCEVTFVTLFVNPKQFGPGEDFERYPRTFQADVEAATAAGADFIFAPSVAEMYPEGEQTRVVAGALGAPLCGASRPGHFDGVLTVVAKFFALFPFCTFVFGRKDFQQLLLVRRMARDLLFPVEVIDHPIVRETDGLAMSSRNVYLSADERKRALGIPRALHSCFARFSAGPFPLRAGELRELTVQRLKEAGFALDYVEVCHPESLEIFPDAVPLVETERYLLAIAAKMGKTRLIDNIVLGEDSSPMERPN